MIAHHPRSKQHLKTREFQAVRLCQQVGRVTGQESLPSTLFLLFATRATVHGHSKPVPGSYLRSTGKPMVTTTCHHWGEKASSWFRYATNVGTTAFLWKYPKHTYGHNEKAHMAHGYKGSGWKFARKRIQTNWENIIQTILIASPNPSDSSP